MAAQKPTIRDVAHAAGVSLGTASRALNRSGSVSADAIEAVARAASKLGYQPDMVAKSMRGTAIPAIGVLLSNIGNPLYSQIYVALEERLQREGYAVLLANTHTDSKREMAMVDMFARHRLSGVFLGPCASESDALETQLASRFGAVVTLDRDMSHVGDVIHVDHFGGAFRATRHLLNLGHQHIALLTPGATTRPGRERIAGYRAAFAERGMPVAESLIRAERSSTEFPFSEALGLLSLDTPPTAFVCLGTRILAGVLKAIKQAGRTIPDELSVVSIGDNDLAQLHLPEITTLGWNFETVGTTAAELLLKRLAAPSTERQRVVFTPEIVLRESCGPRVSRPRPIGAMGASADAHRTER